MDAGHAIQSHLDSHDPTMGPLNPSVMADLVKKHMGETASSQAALAAGSEIVHNAVHKGISNCCADDHAAVIQKHLQGLHQAGMSKGNNMPTRLTREEREKLLPADFADPDRKLYPILTDADLEEAARVFSKVKDGTKLRDNAIQIARRKNLRVPAGWEVAMSVEFSLADSSARAQDPDNPNNVIIPAPIIFRCDNYPDKDFSLTPEEAHSSTVAGFSRVELDLEHKPTVLSGKLGHLTHIDLSETDPNIISGKVSIPKWLDGLLGANERKLSVAFCRTSKKIIGCGIVRNPRVSDAAMMAAFAAAEEAAVATPSPAPAAAATPTAPAVDFASQELQRQLAETQEKLKAAQAANAAEAAQKRKETLERIEKEAVAFAEAEILNLRALPPEQNHLIALYRQAALDDMANPTVLVQFGQETITRVENVRRAQQVREQYRLGEEISQLEPNRLTSLFNQEKPPPAAGKDQPISPERYKQLLSCTQQGRNLLDRGAN